MNIIKSSVTSFNSIEFIVDDFDHFIFANFIVKNNNKILKIKSSKVNINKIIFTLEATIDIKYDCILFYDENIYSKCNYLKLFSSKEFNDKFYTDEKLGAIYNKNFTQFKLWSPVAEKVTLLIYNNGDITEPEKPKRFPMDCKNGLFNITVYEDLKNKFYTYEVKVYEQINETIDPYAISCGINGQRGAIVDLSDTNPDGFENDISPKTINNFTDAIIYEMSIRDITKNPNSGAFHKGKFLGLCEENTKSTIKEPTGLDYIKNLGITHLQIMPMFDFSYKSTDERNPIDYNWGYDPQNYNIPEGSYSTDPYTPITRIRELKEMIQTVHKNGISINMDVVYNHMYGEKDNCFEKVFPGYYFRHIEDGTLSNGSMCGNETASEMPMMRKFIIDSVLYWAKEYHLDGFRFDLMGLHDIQTMNILRNELYKLNRPIMMYGEGWDLPSSLPSELRASKNNAEKIPEIGFFNDRIRDVLKGNVFQKSDQGYISGKENLENEIRICVRGSIKNDGSFVSPIQSINYITCHDNNTLWDKLILTNGFEPEDVRIERQKFSLGIILTCQGIPFFQNGMEFLRSKQGIENSYNSPDSINSVDWDVKDKYIFVTDYIKNLIKIRKKHPSFRLSTLEEITNKLQFLLDVPRNVVAFTIKNDDKLEAWKNILVIYNANRNAVKINLPNLKWNLVVDKYIIDENTIETCTNNYTAEGISISILYSV